MRIGSLSFDLRPQAGRGMLRSRVVRILAVQFAFLVLALLCSLLPPAMRRFLPVLGEDQRRVARALGVAADPLAPDAAGRAAADAVAALVAASPLPHHLREAGVPESDLPAIAVATIGDHMITYVPGPVTRDDVLEILRDAW